MNFISFIYYLLPRWHHSIRLSYFTSFKFTIIIAFDQIEMYSFIKHLLVHWLTVLHFMIDCEYLRSIYQIRPCSSLVLKKPWLQVYALISSHYLLLIIAHHYLHFSLDLPTLFRSIFLTDLFLISAFLVHLLRLFYYYSISLLFIEIILLLNHLFSYQIIILRPLFMFLTYSLHLLRLSYFNFLSMQASQLLSVVNHPISYQFQF